MKKGQQFLMPSGSGKVNATYLGFVDGKHQFSIRTKEGRNIGSGALNETQIKESHLIEIEKGHPYYLSADPFQKVMDVFQAAEKAPEEEQEEALMSGLLGLVNKAKKKRGSANE